jgi:hypothetical protein
MHLSKTSVGVCENVSLALLLTPAASMQGLSSQYTLCVRLACAVCAKVWSDARIQWHAVQVATEGNVWLLHCCFAL